ncbi:MAG TPA: flagellar hook-length control protein FliK [Rhodocyclaceae bacterium]|nr:flagellar hook-length control protein FliK [Rhodocyclaceae bacterium]
MPATSLNPIATVAPPAPSGNASASRSGDARTPEASASADGDFGSALKQQVDRQADDRPRSADEAGSAGSKTRDDTAAAQAPAAPPGEAPPSAVAPQCLGLALFLGQATGRSEADGRPAARTDDDAPATESPSAALAGLLAPQIDPRPTTPAESAPADTTGKSPAKTAAGLPEFAAAFRTTPTDAGSADAPRLPAGTDAAPANSFAGLHAAALAQIRGEAPTPASNALSLPVHTPATHAGWPEEVSNRVSWMVGQHESQAELTLTPPQLGKVEVTVSVSGDQTSAQFVAATPAARDLIEQALPRLRELLGDAGIALGQTSVGTSGQSGNGEGGDGPRRGTAGRGTRGVDGIGSVQGGSAGPWLRRGEGLVDTFA